MSVRIQRKGMLAATVLALAASALLLLSPTYFRSCTRVAAQVAETGRLRPTQVVETGHTDEILSLAFSPNGELLATASKDHTIKLWSVKKGYHLRKLVGHSYPVESVVFSRDGKTLISASRDSVIRWNVITGKPIVLPGKPALIRRVTLSPDGMILASAGFDASVTFRNAATGSVLRSEGNVGMISSFRFSSNGRILATFGLNDRTIKLWDMKTFAPLGTPLVGHTRFVRSIAVSPDGNTVASGGGDSIRRWSVRTGQPRGEPLPEFAAHLTFSVKGDTLACGWKTLRLLDAKTGLQVGPALPGPANSVSALGFSPDGRTLAVGGVTGELVLWDYQTRARLNTFSNHGGVNLSIGFSGDGKTMAVSRYDTVRLWNFDTGRRNMILEGQTGNIYSLAFIRDRTTLATGGSRGCEIWDFKSGDLKRIPFPLRWRSPAPELEFSAGGALFAMAGINHRLVQVGSLETGELLYQLQGRFVKFSPKGRMIAIVGGDPNIKGYDTIKILRAQTGNSLDQLPLLDQFLQVDDVAFSPNEGTLAIFSRRQNKITLWDINTASKRVIPTASKSELPWEKTGRHVAFSSDGAFLASGGPDKSILIFDAKTRLKKSSHFGHTDSVAAIEFFPNSTPNSTLFVSSGIDGQVKLWRVGTKTELATLVFVNQDDWLVTTPDGFFDGSPRAQKRILWRFTQNLFDVAGVDSFYYELYYPGLLKKLFEDEKPRLPPAVVPFEEKDIRQADVRICRKCPCSQKSQFSVATQESERPETEICIDILASPDFVLTDFINFNALARRLIEGKNIISQEVFDTFLPDSRKAIREYAVSSGKDQTKKPGYELLQMMRREMGAFLRQDDFYDRYEGFVENISSETKSLKLSSPKGNEIAWLNRMLLEDAFPESIKRGKISNLESIRGQTAESERNRRTKCPENEVCLQDMRLFWNNRLMQRWRGDMTKNCSTASRYRIQCKTKVPVVSGIENYYSAYLFNQDRVKSTDGELILKE